MFLHNFDSAARSAVLGLNECLPRCLSNPLTKTAVKLIQAHEDISYKMIVRSRRNNLHQDVWIAFLNDEA